MPQAIIKIDKDEFKDRLHIPDGCAVVGMQYNSQTNTIDITIASPKLPDVQPAPEVRLVSRGFVKKTLYELQDNLGNVIDEWAKWTPDMP